MAIHDYGSRSVINVCVVDAGADVGGSLLPRAQQMLQGLRAIATGWNGRWRGLRLSFDGCKQARKLLL